MIPVVAAPFLASVWLSPLDGSATKHASDAAPLLDPQRPVVRIARDSVTLQYATRNPAETVVQVREAELPAAAYQGPGAKANTYAGNGFKTFRNPTGAKSKFHIITLDGLKPGKRYYYRVSDPDVEPTSTESEWGAETGWRREYAVSTQAPVGGKTIVHLPVKVLLMPNVVNAASAYQGGTVAPEPPRMTAADIEKIKKEFAVSSRYLWVNSGMRLWVDYQIFVDDRWQRWGPEPTGATGLYKGLPASRSYAGVDFEGPGGGAFTILDTKDLLKVLNDPVVEPFPYSGQVEMAWPRKWNPQARKWEFYTSGGGTYGVDAFPRGVPARSQFLGGGDAAWLATHEFHHALESHGAFSLSNREDERIVFNHPEPRRRVVKPDGSVSETVWSTSGRHGEHWDVMAFWDRTLSDAQWLRMYFGKTLVVKDADMDGLPDDDARLPLDERRFGSDPRRSKTDGRMNDLHKAMLSTWVPGPLQSSWIKPEDQSIRPEPRKIDTDGDGLPDDVDPYPLYPQPPVILSQRATVDGNPKEWDGIPDAARFQKGGIDFTFRQSADGDGYYGMIRARGPWRWLSVVLDGEGKGVYSGEGVLGFDFDRTTGTARPTFGGAPGLKLEFREVGGEGVLEFRLPNKGPSPWFWERGGREIGAQINVWDDEGRGYSAWEPYRFFYARMLEPNGTVPMPDNPPAEIGSLGTDVTDRLTPQPGWTRSEGVWRHRGGESALFLEVPGLKEFDLFAEVEAKSDAILGAFTPGSAMNAGQGIIAFVGGYGNTATRLRLYGKESGDSKVVMTPGRHRLQLTRRAGEIWLLIDGKPTLYAQDPNPEAPTDRLALLGGYGGAQTIHTVRIR